MATLTVRNLPDELHRALRTRAAAHGRSTEDEVCAILASVLKPESRIRLGDTLAEISRQAGLTNEDVEVFELARDEIQTEALPNQF